MENPKLSVRQEVILGFLQDFIAERKYPPSVREIKDGCGLSSTSVVDYNLKKLKAKGLIERETSVSRGIRLVGEGLRDAARAVPVLGSVSEYDPALAQSESANGRENILLASTFTRKKPSLFALRVNGAADMADALLTSGDVILIDPASETADGDLILARLNPSRKVVVKRRYAEGDALRLHSETETAEPLRVPAKNVTVHGKVVGMIRIV